MNEKSAGAAILPSIVDKVNEQEKEISDDKTRRLWRCLNSSTGRRRGNDKEARLSAYHGKQERIFKTCFFGRKRRAIIRGENLRNKSMPFL